MTAAWASVGDWLDGADCDTGAAVAMGPFGCWLLRIHTMMRPDILPATPKTMASALMGKSQDISGSGTVTRPFAAVSDSSRAHNLRRRRNCSKLRCHRA